MINSACSFSLKVCTLPLLFHNVFVFCFFRKYLFIWLCRVFGAACGIFQCRTVTLWTATCGLELVVPQPADLSSWTEDQSTSSALPGRLLTPGPPETLPPMGALSASLNVGYTAWVPLHAYSFTELLGGRGLASVTFHPETLEELDAC